MKGKLFIVSTPIGNLQDITLRALETLKKVDAIVAEDTRRTRKLLTHYGIKKELISYYKPVEKEKTEAIIKMLTSGKNIALVSDAGTPLMSDPGYLLAKRCIQENIQIVPVPGASAILTALVASGIKPHPFTFWGFLPKGKERKELLKKLKNKEETLVFFESPKRLKESLQDMLDILGNRNCCIARELTKIHEEFIRGPIKELLMQLKEKEILGEVCIVIEGNPEPQEEAPWKETAHRLKEAGFSDKDTAKAISAIFNIPKNEVYRYLLS